MGQPNDKRRMTALWIGVLIGGVGIFILIKQLVIDSKSIEERLIESANEINKTCPVTTDSVIRLDNVVIHSNRTLQYNLTLMTIEKTNPNLEIIKNKLEANLISNIKSDSEMKIFRDNRVTLNYNYKDKDDAFVFNILITPDKYSVAKE